MGFLGVNYIYPTLVGLALKRRDLSIVLRLNSYPQCSIDQHSVPMACMLYKKSTYPV